MAQATAPAPHTRRRSAGGGQNTIYDMVTERVIAQLEAGTVPWRRPWTSTPTAGVAGHPRNGHSGRPYRGINVFLLLAAGYESPYWLSRKQIRELGGTIRAGESGHVVVFWKFLKVEAEKDGEPIAQDVPFLRYYKVWNLDQVDGVTLPCRILDQAAAAPPRPEPVKAAETIIAGYQGGPATHHDGRDRAYYRPGDDTIHLPLRDQFTVPDEYYSTRFHEMGHSTGHPDRLNRHTATDQFKFGSHPYGREELVAEMTAAFLCAEARILPATVPNHAAYVASWLRNIREDRRAVVVAAGAAQRAADHILGPTWAGDADAED